MTLIYIVEITLFDHASDAVYTYAWCLLSTKQNRQHTLGRYLSYNIHYGIIGYYSKSSGKISSLLVSLYAALTL